MHNAGRVDEQFWKTMVDTVSPYPEFVGLSITNPVPIDGQVVARLINDSLGAMIGIINEIDALL